MNPNDEGKRKGGRTETTNNEEDTIENQASVN